MRIAFHREKITPTEPSYLCGHAMRVHKHEAVLDDIYISVLRIHSQKQEYVFASIDLVGLDEELVQRMKVQAQPLGIVPENVILSVIHTHAAPEYTDINMFSGDPSTGARPGYRDFLVTQFAKALQGCTNWKDITACRYKETTIDGYYGNRNNKAYPCDKRVHMLQFLADEKLVYMIVDLSCHPTVLGPQNYKISADLFGAIRDDLEKAYQVPVFMMNGAQGDVSNRQYRQGNDEKELARMCKGICEQLHGLSFSPISLEPIELRDITYVIDYMSDPSKIDTEIEKAKKILEIATDPDVLKVTRSGIAFMEVNKKADPHVHIEIKTRLLQLGDAIIVTVAGELFTKFSLQIKEAFAGHHVFIWGITDASVGYLVEEEEYGKNYESMTTRIPKGEVERYVQHIIQELHKLLDKGGSC